MNCYMIHNPLIKIYNSTSNPKHYIDVKPMEPILYTLYYSVGIDNKIMSSSKSFSYRTVRMCKAYRFVNRSIQRNP